jgi:regulator of protease activity HflC (stomatin/prohibitin superfamily)
MTVRRQAIEFQSSSDPKAKNHDPIQAMSRDNLIVDIEANCPFILNPVWAWWVYQNVGDDSKYVESFVKPAARSALRDAVAKVTFLEAGTENREGLEKGMTEAFQSLVKNDLIRVGKGLDEKQAGEVFVILPVQLRKVLPPDKVQNSINEKIATDQDYQRQQTLTKIAEQIALRRTNEGQGIHNLFSRLPKDITPKDMAGLLDAMAKKENADALMKAVETGQLKTAIFSNGAPIAIPAQ